MYQRVIIVGYLGRDPDEKFKNDGTPISNFSVATTDRWTDKRDGTQKQATVWWKVSAFGKLAEICNEFLESGSFVLLEGVMRANEHGNPKIWFTNDGDARANFEMNAKVLRMLPSRAEAERAVEDAADEEVIPF
jgi:single-strand DNA-binding protein